MKRVAIVGAGLSGLVLARRLSGVADVQVFEKSRGPGGRAATRHIGDYSFDHGTQFFTARSARFRSFLAPLLAAGVVADWPARFAEIDGGRVRNRRDWGDGHAHYVATPGMNNLGKYLAAGINIEFNAEIRRIDRLADGWSVLEQSGRVHGGFDWLVLTAPAAQTAALAERYLGLATQCRGRDMLGCFALMLGFTEPVELAWDAAVVRNADISWMAVNSSKPQRGEHFTMVVHSTNRWADEHIDEAEETVEAHVLAAATEQSGAALGTAEVRKLQRWRYANLPKQSGARFYADPDIGLAACGDWFVRGRIEAAFSSASDLADELLDTNIAGWKIDNW